MLSMEFVFQFSNLWATTNYNIWIHENLPSKLPKLGHFECRKAGNSDYIAKYINKENCLKIKKSRYKISKRILKLFAVVIMVNRINSLIKAKEHSH